MANLDPRLLPLFEVLTRAGLDWLASEMIDGALAGHVPEESRDNLLMARKMALRSNQHAWEGPAGDLPGEESRPFSGDEQVRWAVGHVIGRLTEAIAMMAVSMERVDAIVEKEERPGSQRAWRSATTLILADGETRIETRPQGLTAAAEALEDLRVALERWSSEVLGPGAPA